MDGMQLENIFETEERTTRRTRSKPVKRKWREIEAIKDRQKLQKELMDLDVCSDYQLEDIKL
ncbi:hypothetical protein A9264_07675 [Vibrio sp. UCD-FRSSP16_10]|uniref:DUF3545 family protein n=1 Tax=unclassified Vibrio TaxID=2614977 RepID=UPI0007FF7F6F|nr:MULTISPECIES: DUF3545 family protein [unclassified Vibrio]OBT07313.1 hypothetical protein A9260_08460 [Vibrio sp. UCD-FRSSP16_30]OBT12792.1 hypothetical protein A9264_07675 [Vibrio sp. UCD-FRSSP16_10]